MNDLTQAKKRIKDCQDIQNPYLNLNNCEITDLKELPKLVECDHLKTLILSSNQISDIRVLEKLTGLQSLDLSYNQIKEIPFSIFQLKTEINIDDVYHHRMLWLYGNPIKTPPLDIIKQGKQQALDWFRATRRNLNEIKIILIGEPDAGKTSLLKRVKFDAFNINEVQTDGINIEDIEFGKCAPFKKQTSIHHITGHFWDFGGQETMNATHQLFLTKRSIYVLVLEARKDAGSTKKIRDWVTQIKATGGDSPIIVVANHIDSHPSFGFVNECDLQAEFPQIKCFIKLSCLTGENIELFKEKLAELIPTAEMFNTEIDERWIKVKDKLQEGTKKDYFLNESQFLKICNEVHLNEKQEQNSAITFLHHLGLILHFEDLNLSEYYVLDPYWITYGVYQILTSGYAGTMDGIVDMDKLEFIVNEEEDKKESYKPVNYKKIIYSHFQRRFLIDILHQFKLCFCTADHSHFIIPDLLDTAEPLNITEPIRSSKENVRLVYKYDYLPKFIMPNIMVDTHPIVKKMWRTGCVLENDNGCEALITSYENRISVVVIGAHKKKREFMSIIRFHIDLINKKLSNKPVLLIPLPDVNGFVEYETLLAKEKKGKPYYFFDEDKPTEKQFLISELLEGIQTEDETREFQDEMRKFRDEMRESQKEALEKLDGIGNQLNSYHTYLIENLPNYNEIKDGIQEAIREINAQQMDEISGEIMNTMAMAFDAFDGEMDDKLKKIYNDLKNTDDVQAKLKLSVPFINLLGINFETEFDIKNWAKKMYEKYNLEIFKLMDYSNLQPK